MARVELVPHSETPSSLPFPPGVCHRPALRWALTLSFLAGLSWALVLLMRSPGALRQDEIAHYLIARYSLSSHILLLDVWGKVGYNLIYVLPSQAGWEASRVFSVILSSLTVFFTVRVARQLRAPFLWLTPLFCWFQPWFARLSFTALLEPLFTLLGVAGVSLALDGRFARAGLVIGFLPLVRHEGLLWVGLFALASAARRQWRGAAAALVPITLYNLAAWHVRSRWPLAEYTRPSRPDILQIGTGDWLFYVRLFPDVAGIPVTLLATLGLVAMLRRPAARYLLLACALYVAAHSVVYRFGLWAAGGEARYLMPLAPVFAISAAFGLQSLRDLVGRLGPLKAQRVAAVGFAVVTAAVIAAGLTARPYRMDREQVNMREAASWLREQGFRAEQIHSTHVWFYHYFPLEATPAKFWSHPPNIDRLPAGSVVVWDAHYSEPWGLRRETLTAPASGWTMIRSYEGARVEIFRKG
jgi:hypothetical protein